MNRCSGDIENTDLVIPLMLNMFVTTLFMLIGAIVLASSILPLLVLILIAPCILFIHSTRRYLRTSTELRRVNQLAVSPLLSLLSEFINGAKLINTYQSCQFLIDKWKEQHNLVINTSLHEDYANIWMMIRLQIFLNLIISLSCILILFNSRLP